MFATEQTVSKPYANDRDYDAFRGRVVAKYVTKLGITDDGYVIGRVTRVIDIGRADPIVPCDPELAIADEEPWEEAQPVVPAKPFKPQARTAKLLAAIFEQLQERPLSTRELADTNGVSLNQIALLIQRYKDSFEQLASSPKGAIYGIKGHRYERIYTKSMPRILDYLRVHGPSTAKAICEGLGITQQTLNNADNDNAGVLAIVDYVEKKGIGKKSLIYGIAGIHDTQQGAA